MKLCKNCKYYKQSWVFETDSKCTKEQAPEIAVSKVTGKIFIVSPIRYCDILRNYSMDSTCGPEAKWYEEVHS